MPLKPAAIAVKASVQVAGISLPPFLTQGRSSRRRFSPSKAKRPVGHPFLVHVVIGARQDAQHLAGPRIDADIGARRIQDIDAVGLAQFPGAG